MNMKKNVLLLITAILTAVNLQACHYSGDFSLKGNKRVTASNNYVTKDIRVKNFNGIKVIGSPDVVYTQQSGKPRVEIYAADNIVDLLDINIKDNTLIVKFKEGYSISYKKMEVRVFAEELDNVSVVGSGDITLKNGLKTDNLRLSIAGSGDINGKDIECKQLEASVAGSGDINHSNVRCQSMKLSVAGSGDIALKNIKAGTVQASVAGSGDISLEGNAEKAEYSVAGSGDIDADRLKTKSVEASTAGSGDIECHATEYLKAKRTGSGEIGYKGNPSVENTNKKKAHKL